MAVRAWTLALLALAVAGCTERAPLATPFLGDAPFRELAAGNELGGAPGDPGDARFFNNTAEWASHWSARHGDQGEAPSADFYKERVLGVWGPPEPYAQHQLNVTGITVEEALWVVRYEIHEAGRGCVLSPAFGRPYEYVAVGRGYEVAAVSLQAAGRKAIDC